MLTSIHNRDGEQDDVDASERLRFVAGWFRILGFILVGIWILSGVAIAAVGFTDRHAGPGVLLIGAAGAALGILITAPLYFWFSAIASGVAALVDHSRAKT